MAKKRNAIPVNGRTIDQLTVVRGRKQSQIELPPANEQGGWIVGVDQHLELCPKCAYRYLRRRAKKQAEKEELARLRELVAKLGKS